MGVRGCGCACVCVGVCGYVCDCGRECERWCGTVCGRGGGGRLTFRAFPVVVVFIRGLVVVGRVYSRRSTLTGSRNLVA